MLLEIVAAFLKLGLTSFGGPIAHIEYMRREIVEKRAWLSAADFADLVALCQFLPGPASSQLVFALGKHRGGWAGAFLASSLFTAPSAALMIAFAYAASLPQVAAAGALHGLKLAAVAVVAQAVLAMRKSLCPDSTRLAIAFAAAAALVFLPGPLTQLALIAAGAVVGVLVFGAAPAAPPAPPVTPARPPAAPPSRAPLASIALLGAFAALLVLLPIGARVTGDRTLAEVDVFYRAGALVFGGGHVILPLLRAELAPRFVTDADFLAGYGAVQAMPGPLFTLSAYLGTASALRSGASPALAGGLACLLAIFLPAWLLVAGALPLWSRLKASAQAQAALKGANAVVVGVLLAALYSPVITTSVHDVADAAVAVVAFAALYAKAPPWAVVVVAAVAGELMARI